jgi:hypothetical protein
LRRNSLDRLVGERVSDVWAFSQAFASRLPVRVQNANNHIEHMSAGLPQTQQKAPLFDHLVGEQLDRVGHLETKCPGRLQVDDKLEFGGLRDRQVGGLHAL